MNEDERQQNSKSSPPGSSGLIGSAQAMTDVGNKIARNTAKKGVEAASNAASASAGAATGGAATAAKAVIQTGAKIGKLGDTQEEMSKGTNSEIGKILIVIACFIIIFLTTISSIIHYYMPSPAEAYIENQYLEVEASGEKSGNFFQFIFRTVARFFGYDYEKPKRYEVIYEDSLNTDIDIIKKGLTKAFEEVAPREVKSVIKEKKYDYSLTWASWKENENPYLTDGKWNVNFAEFMIILNEANELAINTFVPEAYQEFMDNEENLQFLYYLEFDEKWRFIENYEKPELVQKTEYGVPVYDSDGNPEMETQMVPVSETWDVPAGQTSLTTPRGTYSLNENNTTLWAVVTIFKYDLLDLCDMVDVDIDAPFQYADSASNMDMYLQTDAYEGYMMEEDQGIAYQELILRAYSYDVDLGPAEKTPFARHHHNGLEDSEYGVGENGEIPKFDPNDLDNVPESLKYLLEWLYSKVGNPYSQALRDDGYHFDCSSLVYYAYKQIGVNVSYHGSTTAASIAKGLAESGKNISASNLQPGDIIFYSYENNGRYKNISHTAIYIGNGMIIDARGSKYGVVKRSLPTKSIVMCARPLS